MLYNRDEQRPETTIAEYGALCKFVSPDILDDEQDALLAVWNAIPSAKPENDRAYLLKDSSQYSVRSIQIQTTESVRKRWMS